MLKDLYKLVVNGGLFFIIIWCSYIGSTLPFRAYCHYYNIVVPEDYDGIYWMIYLGLWVGCGCFIGAIFIAEKIEAKFPSIRMEQRK